MAGNPLMLGQSVRQALLLALQIVLMMLLSGFVLLLADRHNRRFDFSPLKQYVISKQSKKIVAGLSEPTRILYFYDSRESGRRRQVADLFDQFTAVSPLLSYRLYDLDRTPGLAKKYDISSYNTGAVESRGRVEPLSTADEVAISSALLRLSTEHTRQLCFMVGHGEHDPRSATERTGYSDVAKNLEMENFAIRTYDVLPSPADLKSCTLVIMAGPRGPFFGDEEARLSAFLEGGGRLLILIDPETPASITDFLERFGIEAPKAIIADQRNRLYGADAFMPRVPIFDRETFHKNLDTAAIFPLARPVVPMKDAPPRVEVTLVALSSPESWARVGDSEPTETTPEFRREVDEPGPVPVAVMATVHRDKEAGSADGTALPGKMVVFGDSDFPSNFYLNLIGNKDLFMSTVGVLAEDSRLVAVRQKDLPKGTLSPIYLTARQGQLIFWLAVVVIPGVALAIGGLVAWRRRLQGS